MIWSQIYLHGQLKSDTAVSSAELKTSLCHQLNSDSAMWSAEHSSDKGDIVNLVMLTATLTVSEPCFATSATRCNPRKCGSNVFTDFAPICMLQFVPSLCSLLKEVTWWDDSGNGAMLLNTLLGCILFLFFYWSTLFFVLGQILF